MKLGGFAIDDRKRTRPADQICGDEKTGKNEEKITNHLMNRLDEPVLPLAYTGDSGPDTA